MKIQDIVFLIVFAFLLLKRNPQLFVAIGILFFAFAIPFFSFWVFFTAERLVWYGTLFILFAILISFYRLQKEDR